MNVLNFGKKRCFMYFVVYIWVLLVELVMYISNKGYVINYML